MPKPARPGKMVFRYTLIFFIILTLGPLAVAKPQDSVSHKKLVPQIITPITLITTGIIVNNSQLEKNLQENLRSNVGDQFNSDLDDYLQYAPIAELYIADIAGVKSRNHWFDQTKYLLISNLISSGITHGLKHLTLKARPNGAPYSFPSGHATFAFTNATVLFNEIQETSPLLAFSGYAFAASTGAFRMLNNKHWLSDVMVGAGIGIFVTEIVYYLEPFKAFNPFRGSDSYSFIPKITDRDVGFYFQCEF
jgi:hypothetical protein